MTWVTPVTTIEVELNGVTPPTEVVFARSIFSAQDDVGGTKITLEMPFAMANDVALVVIHINGNHVVEASTRNPYTWTAVADGTDGNHSYYVFTRRLKAGTAFVDSYFDITAAVPWSAFLLTLGNVNESSIFDVSPTANFAVVDNVTAPGITTLSANALHIVVGMCQKLVGVTSLTSTPAGYTAHVSLSAQEGLWGGSKTIPAAGAVAAQSFVATGATETCGLSMAIKTLSTVGGGWTDITADVTKDPIVISYGLKTNRPDDRCASTGTLSFVLRNDARNSGGQLGYYSTTHASKRTGWEIGIRVRAKQVYSGDTRYFMGTLTTVAPDPGQFKSRQVHCVAVDWMDNAATAPMRAPVQVGNTSDAVFRAVVSAVDRPPATLSIAAGSDTYPYALDSTSDAEMTLLTLSDLARSEQGLIYAKRDGSYGQTVCFEGRGTRAGYLGTTLVTLSNTMTGLDLPGDRTAVLNHFRAVAYPREVRTSVVVASIPGPLDDAMNPGGVRTVRLNYTDPDQRASVVGAVNVQEVDATDVIWNSALDGSGVDLTADVSVTVTVETAGITFDFSYDGSSGGGLPAYLTTCQARGDALVAFQRVTSEAFDDTSILAYGRNQIAVDMRWQSLPVVAKAACDYWLSLYKDPIANARSVTFFANQSAAVMTAAITGDISSLVCLSESVTGLTAASFFFINGVEIAVDKRVMAVTWWLSPASIVGAAWLLGTAGASELDQTTVVGYY